MENGIKRMLESFEIANICFKEFSGEIHDCGFPVNAETVYVKLSSPDGTVPVRTATGKVKNLKPNRETFHFWVGYDNYCNVLFYCVKPEIVREWMSALRWAESHGWRRWAFWERGKDFTS